MSTTIDSRVVEMRFDNKQFESNVSTTMSTLEKLKQKLHLDGATKGLENVNSAAKNVNMSGLSGAVETVSAKFSALEVMGVTALANITNSAVNAGKRIVSALTIDPIKTGLSEYETKMNAIQVIQANTRGKNTMDEITAALEDLNVYADKTIYNFAQMTSNIGKFTAQGFDVQSAANAVKGLANLAAASGASAEDMARATYQMSQAMGGSVKLMDWNSLRNANMATQALKDTLIDLAKVHGIAIDDMIEQEGTFEQTLQSGWLTGKMFTEAMNIYSGVYSEAELAAMGFNESQIENFKGLAEMAASAATEVKTFTQMWDVLKETAQSGWTQTWELIFGDFTTAKAMFTNLQNYFSDIINGWSDIRNTLLGGALNLESPWASITEKLENSGIGKIAEKIEDATNKLTEFQAIVNDVWRGDYGNSDTGRFELLEQAGYDHRVVQELVNKGYEYELTVEDIEEAHKKFGLTLSTTAEQTKAATSAFNNLSDEELKNAGLTEGEIRLYKALAAEAERTGVSIEELADEMSKADGRTMVIDSIKNAWDGLVTILTAVREAWENVFPPLTVVQLYGAIKGLNEFSKKLKVSDESADKLRRTFEGLFAVLDIITTIAGGAFKIAFKAATQLLGYFDLDVLTLTANIGDALVKFRDWIDASLDFTKVFDKIVPPITKAITAFREWIASLKKSENLPEDIAKGIMNGFGKAVTFVGDVIRQLVDMVKSGFTEIPEFLNSGLVNGITNGAKVVGQVFIELGKMILEKIKGVLGIHSPSKEFFEIGKNITQGLINGIKTGLGPVVSIVKELGMKCIDALREMDFGTLFAGALMVGGLVTVQKLADAISSIASPLEGLGDMLEEFGDAAKTVSKGVKNFLNAQALLAAAIAIAILAKSVSMLAELDAASLWNAVGVVAALAAVVVALTFVSSKINSVGGVAINPKAILSIIAISAALLLLALAMTKLASIDGSNVGTVLATFAAMLAGFIVISKMCRGTGIIKMGGTLIAMSVALLIMTGVIQILGRMDNAAIKKGLKVIVAFELFVVALMAVATLSRGSVMVKMGGTLLAMSIALLILTVVIKQIDKLDGGAIERGIKVIAALELLFIALVAVTGILGGNVAIKTGGTLLSLSIGLLAMIAIIKLIAGIDDGDVERGIKVIASLELLFVALIAVSSIAGKNAGKAGVMLLLMSAAMLVLAGVLFIVSLLDPEGLERALVVVATLEILMIALVTASKHARKTQGAIVALTIALALLVAAVTVLTFVDQSKLDGAVKTVITLMGALSIMIASLGMIKNAKQLWSALIPMIAVVAALTAVVWALSQMNPEAALPNAIALSVLMLAMSTALVIADKAGQVSTSAIVALTAMSAAAALAGLIIAMMGALETENAIINATALGILLNLMATAMLIADKAGQVSASAIAGMTAMNASAVLAGLILSMMGGLQTENAIINATALGILLNLMAAAMFIADKAGPVSVSAIAGLTAMNAAAGLAALILAMMTGLGVENAIENATALGILLDTMSIALVIASVAGAAAPAALIGMGLLAAFIAELALLIGGIGALVTEFPQLGEFVENGVPMLVKLGEGLGQFAGSIIGGLLEGITDSLPAVADNLSSFAVNLSPFLKAIKGIDAKSTEGVKNIASIVLTLTAANVLDGLTSWFTGGNSLTKFGKELAELGPYVKKYADSVKGIDANKVKTSAEAVGALAEVAKALPNSGGVVSWFTGNNDMKDFGKQLASLGESLVTYSKSVSGLTDSSLARIYKSVDATKAITEMAKALPNSGGVVSWFTGNNDMDAFGTALATYGGALVAYASSVSRLTDDAIEQVYTSVDATKALAEMASVLPNTGGLVGVLVGNNDMDGFGTALASYGSALVSYANAISWMPDDSIEKIYSSVDATKALAEMAKVLPNGGGVISWFAGNNDLATFGTALASFGQSLIAYANSIIGLDESAVERIHASVSATKALAEMASVLPNSSGVMSWFAGGNDIDDFGTRLAAFGLSLVEYSNSVSGLNVEAITRSVAAANEVVKMASALPDSAIVDNNGILGRFGKSLKSFGESIVAYSDTVTGLKTGVITTANTAMSDVAKLASTIAGTDFTGMNSLSSNVKTLGKSLGSYGDLDASGIAGVTREVKSLVSVATTASQTDFSGLSAMSTALGELGASGVDNFMRSFDGASDKATGVGEKMMKALIAAIQNWYSKFVDEGKAIVGEFVSGIKADRDNATDEVKTMSSNAADAPDDYYDSFYGAGSYMVSGFVSGIRDSIDRAASAAAAMAAAAIEAAQAELDEHSPSRVFYGIGDYAGLGFINALDDYGDKSYEAGANIADSARYGLSDAIRKIVGIIDSDLDTQPTIRPVLDLSEVRSGADTIGDLFGMSPSVGVLSKVSSISASMNGRGQNGDNGDIISAINKLRKDIGNMQPTSYTINGITYDDGSNVSDAVRALVRAAKVERRT